jgi:hypothetical protein
MRVKRKRIVEGHSPDWRMAAIDTFRLHKSFSGFSGKWQIVGAMK